MTLGYQNTTFKLLTQEDNSARQFVVNAQVPADQALSVTNLVVLSLQTILRVEFCSTVERSS